MDVASGISTPRAFYPDYVDQPPPQHGRPGWDTGPERRIDDGRTVARALARIAIGLGLLGLAALVSAHRSRVA